MSDLYAWDLTRARQAAHLRDNGLYDPASEHDACGVGLVCAIDGKPRRSVVEMGIAALKSVWHRGAVVSDGKTGDGAGIKVELPRAFFHDYLTRTGRALAAGEVLAVGMAFLPKRNLAAQEACRAIVETCMVEAGFTIYGWRQVPVNPGVIGDIANDSRPEIEQIMVGGPAPDTGEAGCDSGATDGFERSLYLVRRRIEKQVTARGIADFYLCSLSGRYITYKGLFKAEQLSEFYPDLLDERFESSYAVFHQRFSTNTAPAWHLAQPFQIIAHNGEINTLKGNINWMKAHEANMAFDGFEGRMEDVKPVLNESYSDTGMLDAAVELHVRAGRELPLAKVLLVPPAWVFSSETPDEHKALFSYCNCISEPWDGPAAIAATDGRWVIAGMDRNGLRPMRYSVTDDGLLVVGSESGMVPVDEQKIVEKGRLGPGDVIGVDLGTGVFFRDRELKDYLAAQAPYEQWVENITELKELPQKPHADGRIIPQDVLRRYQATIGQTVEEEELILHPMGEGGKEAVGSMGDDTPLAVLSHQHRPFSHFFRQTFSQVTNPPIDSLRERRVMSLYTRFGNSGNVLAQDDRNTHSLLLPSPILLNGEFEALCEYFTGKTARLSVTFAVAEWKGALEARLRQLMAEAEAAAREGAEHLILTDRGVDAGQAPLYMILAVAAVHSHLIARGLRKQVTLIVETAECQDVHGFAVLIGVGATAVNPWLAEEVLAARHARGVFGPLALEAVLENFKEAMSQGLLKIMSKLGISVVSSYRGGCNFEIIGLSRALVAQYFPGMPSRISGIGFKGLERRIREQHAKAWGAAEPLPVGGFYRYRAGGEQHGYEAQQIHMLQTAVTKGAYQLFKKYSESVQASGPLNLRDMLDFHSPRAAVPIDQVESITEIRKRFIAPAMSLGALSPEAHETLAIAMNRMGASSNSGEGGEDPERYTPRANGDNANSVIKQVASARFGVTAEYLNSATELQIKVAQGAKPGEGGQLPGFKVTEMIARLRHATPGVTLISPPPHHDIYSIEDLAQLIYDLKQINPRALVSVKLVSQAGIGTVASGVAKAMADKILIAGHSGGTGASPLSSVKFAGLPWELGLAEANQVLTLNHLRHRVKLQADGGLKTGRDVVIAAMLGAEEFGVGTASLVAMGCIMVRQCHSNTCPVGVCTQDPALRAKFEGSVEKVVNLFSFIAEEVREILASLGFTRLDEVIGRSDLLTQVHKGSDDLVDLDLNPILCQADPGPHPRIYAVEGRNEVPESLDAELLRDARGALERGEKIQRSYTVRNVQRTIGARLSSMMVRRFDVSQLQPDHVNLQLRGSAGQSLGAFAVHGLRIEVLGDANDYVAKGLSGGTIAIRPKPSSPLVPHENVIIGNTVLYGATSGYLFAAGQAGERFAVRNSGATAVVEGCGANGCEYMTGGTAVILGPVGDNFAAGMTGGMAFVYDAEENFAGRVNPDTVVWQRLESDYWAAELRALIERHALETGSPLASSILGNWPWEQPKFWQVCPKEMVSRLSQPLRRTG